MIIIVYLTLMLVNILTTMMIISVFTLYEGNNFSHCAELLTDFSDEKQTEV